MLHRLVYTFFDEAAKVETFQPYRIGVAVKIPPWALSLLRGVAGESAVVSLSVTTPRGSFKSGDVLWISEPRMLAMVKLAVKVPNGDRDFRFVFVVKPFLPAIGGGWSDVLGAPVVVDSSSATSCVANVRIGGKVFV
jgi:hypothetical protein